MLLSVFRIFPCRLARTNKDDLELTLMIVKEEDNGQEEERKSVIALQTKSNRADVEPTHVDS